MTKTTTPLQPTTVEPTKLQPTTPAGGLAAKVNIGGNALPAIADRSHHGFVPEFTQAIPQVFV